MARSLEQERKAIAEEARRLDERRQRLAEKERDTAIEAIERAGLFRLDHARLMALVARIGTLGADEVERRLAS